MEAMMQTHFASDARSKAFYRAAGMAAVLIVLVGLIDAATSMGIEARDNRSVPIVEWFGLFQTQPFAAFSSLGVINLITLTLGIPIYVAFNQADGPAQRALTGLASILFFVGTTVYLSSNTVFALFGVSQQYAVSPEAQKPLLEAAGRALTAQGADLTPGTFLGLFLTQAAGLVITSAMLRGNVFGRWTGWTGRIGFSLMTLFFILTAFVPEQYAAALRIAAPGGVILMAYQLMLSRRFFQLGR
jgi:hypothetical protein